ncbi:hypothetical protein EON64_00270 [archaeon]|nr:MAG: hypothetical protein EON64_00270 [archaeon]
MDKVVMLESNVIQQSTAPLSSFCNLTSSRGLLGSIFNFNIDDFSLAEVIIDAKDGGSFMLNRSHSNNMFGSIDVIDTLRLDNYVDMDSVYDTPLTRMRFQMNLTYINSILPFFVYQPSANVNGQTFLSMSVLYYNSYENAFFSRNAAPLRSEVDVAIDVVAVNTLPVFENTRHISAIELLMNETACLDFVLVDDVDSDEPTANAGGGYIDLHISSQFGKVYLSSSHLAHSSMYTSVVIVDDGSSSGQVSASGSIRALRSFISSHFIRYKLDSSYAHGPGNVLDTVTWRAWDNGFTGISLNDVYFSSFSLTIENKYVPEPIRLVATKDIIMVEDTPIALFRNVSILASSYDMGEMVVLYLSKAFGSYSFDAKSVSEDPTTEIVDGADMLVIQGSVRALQRELAKLVFVPLANMNRFFVLQVELEHYNSSSNYVIHKKSYDMKAFIYPVNDLPVMSLTPSTASVVQSQKIMFQRDLLFVVSDVDNDDTDITSLYSLTISAPCGMLTLESIPELAELLLRQQNSEQPILMYFSSPVYILSNKCVDQQSNKKSSVVEGYHTLRVDSAGLDIINMIVQSLVYTAPSDFVGQAEVLLTLQDAELSVSTSLEISVKSKATLPAIAVQDRMVHLLQGGVLEFSSLVTSIKGNSYTGRQDPLNIIVWAESNLLAGEATFPVLVNVPAIYAAHVVDLASEYPEFASMHASGTAAGIRGTLDELKGLLPLLTLSPAGEYSGRVTIHFLLSSMADNHRRETSIDVLVEPVNHQPSLTYDMSALMIEDVPSDLSIRVHDIDVNFLMTTSSPLYTQHAASCCYMSLSLYVYDFRTAGANNLDTVVLLSYNDSLHTSIVFTGTPAQINSQLSFVRVVGNLDFHGKTALFYNLTEGISSYWAPSASPLLAAIPLNINAVNDLPVLYSVVDKFSFEDLDNSNIQRYIFNLTHNYNMRQFSNEAAEKLKSISSNKLFYSLEEDGVLAFGKDILLFDVDAQNNELIYINIHTSAGVVSIPGGDTSAYGSVTSSHSSGTSLNITAEYKIINKVVDSLVFVAPKFYTGYAYIFFSISDEKAAERSTYTVSVYIYDVNHSPAVVVDYNLTATEDTIVAVDSVQVVDGDNITTQGLYEAEVFASYHSKLEVVNVSVLALSVPNVQLITLLPSTSNRTLMLNTMQNNQLTYKLVLDLTSFGYGRVISKPIYLNAISNQDAEVQDTQYRGHDSYQSVQYSLQSLYVMNLLNITVEVEMLDTYYSNNVPQLENVVFVHGSPYALNYNNTNSKGSNMEDADVANKQTRRQFNVFKSYRVVFHNAPRNFPTLQVLFNASASVSITAKCVHPGNFVSGSFNVIFNNISTAALPYDVSEEEMTEALEALPNVGAVGVTRSYVNKYINVFDNNIGVYDNNYINSYSKQYNYTFINNNVMEYLDATNVLSGVYKGYMWSITFFVVSNNANHNNNRDATTPLMTNSLANNAQNFITVNATDLRGVFSYVTPDGVVDYKPFVQVHQVQPQVGQAEVYVLKEKCQYIPTVISINYFFNRSVAADSQANMYQDSFYLNVSEPITGAWELMGPIFPFTNDKEHVHKNPINQELFTRVFGTDTDQYRLEGEAEGQSMETLFRSLSFFSLFAEDLQVTKTFIDSGRSILISWRVAFVNNDYRPLAYTLVPYNLSPVTNVSVSTLQASNNIGGSFRMLNRNNMQVTDNISYDVSAEQLERILQQELGLQDVVVSRKGPEITGSYTYYVAIVYNSHINGILESLDMISVYNDSSRNINNIAQGLPGYGASISSQRISKLNTNYGVRLTGSHGVSNALPTRLYTWQKYLSFRGSLSDVNAALKTMEFQPATDFFGVVDLIVRVKDNVYIDGSISERIPMQDQQTLSVTFYPNNDAPAILFASSVLSYDYTGKYSSDNNNVYNWIKRREIDQVVVVHVQVYESQLTPLGGEMLFLSNYSEGAETVLTYTSTSLSEFFNRDASLVGSASYNEPRRVISSSGIQVRDIDSAFVTVTLEVLHGHLSIDNNILPYGESTPVNFHNNKNITTVYVAGVNGRNLTIAGGINEVNRLLMTLSYMPPIQASGYDILTIRASDQDMEESLSDVKMVQGHIVLDISPINDAPTISFALPLGHIIDDQDRTYNYYHPFAILNITEDMSSAVGQYITIYDTDFNESNVMGLWSKYPGSLHSYPSHNSGNKQMFVLFKVEHGRLTGHFPGSVRFVNISIVNSSPSQLVQELSVATLISYNQYRAAHPLSYSKVLCFTGTYSDVLAAVDSLQYAPDADYYGADVMSIYVNDLGNIGLGGPKDVSNSIIINIESVPDRPRIVLPTGQSSTLVYVYEDTIGILGADQYVNNIARKVSHVSEGTLSNLYVDTWVFNMTSSSIFVVDRDDYVYVASERVVVRDTANYSNVLTNDPVFNQTFSSASSFDIYRFVYNSNHITNHDGNSRVYTLEVSVKHGRLSFNRVPTDVTFVLGSGFEDDHVIVTGNLNSINILLAMLFYKADPNYNANSNNLEMFDTLLLNVSDPYGLWDIKTLSLFVVPVNDAPVLAYGESMFHDPFLNTHDHSDYLSPNVATSKVIQCIENTACLLESVHVRDLDASEYIDNTLSNIVTVVIMTGKGHVRIDVNENSLLYSTQRSTAQSFSVDIGAEGVTSVLRGLIYVPDQDTYGYDSLFIEVSDNGNTGLCIDSLNNDLPSNIFDVLRSNPCPLKVSLNMTIFIQPVHDHIDIRAGDYYFTHEDTAVLLDAISFVNHEHHSLQANADKLNGFPGVADVTDFDSLQSLYPTPVIADTSGKVFTVRLTSTHGIFTLTTVPRNISFVYNYNDIYSNDYASSVYLGNNNTAELVIMGILPNLNLALQLLAFLPDKDVNIYNRGLASLNVRIYDENVDGGNATWQVASTNKDIFVNIRPVNDAPLVLLPGESYRVLDEDIVKIEKLSRVETVHISEDTLYSLNTLRLYDVDEHDYKYNLYTLTLLASNGEFAGQSLSSQMRLQLYRDAHPTSLPSRVELSGSLAELGSVLETLAYRPNLNYYGVDDLEVKICESYLNDTQVDIYMEGTTYAGTLYPAHKNVLCSSRTLPLSIYPVNDAPSLVHAGTLVSEVGGTHIIAQANKAYHFGAGGEAELLVMDVDSEEDMYLVSLRVKRGLLTLGYIGSEVLLIDGMGENDKHIVVAGAIDSVNQALASLVYLPPTDYDSTKDGSGDILAIQVRDDVRLIGRNVSFLPNSLVADLSIFVAVSRGVPLSPTINLPGVERRSSPCVSAEGQSGERGDVEAHPVHEYCGYIIRILNFNVTEDTPTIIPNVSFSQATETDRFFNLKLFAVNLTTLHGSLTLPAETQGVRVQRGVEYRVGSKVLSLVGTMGNINLLLKELVYTPPIDYYGDDYLSVYVSDEVRGGGRQGRWSNETLPLQIIPVPDAPLIHINISYPKPMTKVLEVWEDMKLTIRGVTLSDPDYVESVATPPTYNRTEDERHGVGANKRRGSGAAKGVGGEGGEARGQGLEGIMLHRSQQDKGLLRLDVEVLHGRTKFSSMEDLAILTLPSAADETDRLSSYPLSQGSLEERNIYEGIESYFDLATNTTLSYSSRPGYNASFKVCLIKNFIFFCLTLCFACRPLSSMLSATEPSI